MLHYIDLNQMSAYYGLTVEALKDRKYSELEAMERQMKKEKAELTCKRNAEDEEYARIVRKYFSMYDYLRTWFSDEEIIRACSLHASVRDLTKEVAVRKGEKCCYPDAEYVETKQWYLPKYYRGHLLEERERCLCDMYRIKHQYQGNVHGKIVLELLYTRYPELQRFGFSAYSGEYADTYMIYPKNNIFTPFTALMSGDIEAIRKWNLDYSKSYNMGEFTVTVVKERLESDEAERYFDMIRMLAV
ncbi:MAG: hypothetical protein LUE86_13225 [Clostridiales bacterium]|nr:hypothetical protein [Clostridiales bacterium]